ncbi:helix-turn-helix domain-containing protein [bacterium]|nr:helix-turn-helix domain-containing protein [bacterium]MBU1958559.1 helix-turn-helix domain-containing protein [bacterium]
MVLTNDDVVFNNIPTHRLTQNDIYMQPIDMRYHPNINKPHRHDFFEILWFIDEGEEHIIDFKSYPIRKNELFFLAPGKIHSLNTYNKQGFLIVLSQEFISYLSHAHENCFFSLFYTFDSRVSCILNSDEEKTLKILYSLLFNEYQNKLQDIRLLQSYCRSFLLFLQRTLEQQMSNIYTHHNRIGILSILIEKYYKAEKYVDFYASKLELTPKRLNELSKNTLGFTVSQLIKNRIILEAKREIYFNTLSMNEIAYALGYNDPAYFSRFFKKETGFSPKAYQNKQKVELKLK